MAVTGNHAGEARPPGDLKKMASQSRTEGWFEVIVGKSMAEDGESSKCFGFVSRYDNKESVKFRGQSGHAAFASVLLRKAGYQRRKVSSRSPLRTLVRVCSKRCAPRGVHRICCFFTNRLLMT